MTKGKTFLNLILLLAFAVAMAGVVYSFVVTSRNIAHPTTVYSEPYETHGGTVYISKNEKLFEDISSWTMRGGILILIPYLIFQALRRKNGS